MYATKSDSLDAEQKKRIEENRRKAIALRNASIARLETEGSRTEYSSRSTNDSHVKFAERNPQISKNLTAASQPKSLAKVVGSCSVTSRCRFTVTVNYHQKLVDIFKTLPSNVYGKHFIYKCWYAMSKALNAKIC